MLFCALPTGDADLHADTESAVNQCSPRPVNRGKSVAPMVPGKLAIQFLDNLQLSEDILMGEIVVLSLIVGALGALTFFYFRVF